ncbi:DUF2993 domain-containing protein [Actinotalea sp.]|uniref:LmeA family phospholipid-binding protein n=1 Tax=Actinotalea sp. TaxID=1872145 RepID=UPI003569AD04
MKTRLVVALLVVAVVAVVLVVADVVLRSRVEQSIAGQLGTELGMQDARVTVTGTPFLTQVLSGSLDRVEVSAPSAVLDGVRLRTLEATLLAVSTGTPRTAAELRFSAAVEPSSLAAVLPDGVQVDGDADRLSVTLAGLPVTARVVPTAAGRSIAIGIEELEIGGVIVQPENLPFGLGDGLTGLSLPLDDLPEGVELTSVSVVGGLIRVEAAGTDVLLPDAAAVGVAD